jgi:wyosine [tRNA(Phe)-imidazoG37] synthetase (radical SAM superfamily)
MEADWVSLKIDTLSEKKLYYINRTHKYLKFGSIIEGNLQFANDFNHELTTETMLLKGVNDSKEEIEKVAKYLEELKPDKAYVAIPSRKRCKTGK